ncbi:cytochrome P450 [Mangrovimicrobium sediminis]|uniref:Cytochrome P450 n=1 Tax=Mangrovimicrobium sediminis TaxID=2562682 RepID=A0A4Z0M5C5_9GAMM|nr:cytochrome P450 [Haliea sp. SAOS-164]TGD74646.1 cytochrome P450 [Haliea sp. SAOS-164]
MTTPSPEPLPQLDLASLQADLSGDLTRPTLLGFTAQSWLRAQRELGPVFAVPAMNTAVLAGRDASRSAWRNPQDWSYAQTGLGQAFRAQLGEGYITASDGDAHWEQRRVLQPLFNSDNIQRHAPVVATLLAQGLQASSGQPVELHDTLVLLFTRILNHSMVRTGASDAQIQSFARFEEEFIRGATAADSAAWYARPAYRQLHDEVFSFFRALVQARLAGERGDDNLDLLVDALRKRGAEPDLDELVRDAYLMQAGGAGNIASLCCSLLWALLQHPEWLQRVREELASFDPAQLARSGMQGLTATRAAILETERRYPVTPGMPKLALNDVVVQGRRVPAGSQVFHLFTLEHFLEEDYPEPFDYRPQRWLDGKPPRPNAFGGGRHMCIGMNLAYLHLLQTLALLLKDYEIDAGQGPRLAPIEPDNPDSPSRMVFEVSLRSR